MKVVQMIDYLANYRIFKKDFVIVEDFLKKHLSKVSDHVLFAEVRQQISELKTDCYHGSRKIKKDPQA